MNLHSLVLNLKKGGTNIDFLHMPPTKEPEVVLTLPAVIEVATNGHTTAYLFTPINTKL